MSVFTPVDAGVRDRIRSDLAANLCVEAGAGTGKTTVLVSRIVEVLRTGFASVDEIAVITFTEAAAAELAARVRQSLEDAFADAASAEERSRIHAALQGLHRAHVETIHAFAAGLLRERPVEAGLDPGFEVLDDLAAQLAFDEAYGAWLTGLLADTQPAVITAINRGFDLGQIRKLVQTVHDHRSLLPLASEVAPPADIASFRAELRAAIGEFPGLLADCREDEAGRADMQTLSEWALRLSALEGDRAEFERELLFRAPRLNPGKGRQDQWDDPASCRRSKELRKDIREASSVVHAALRTEAVTGLLPLAAAFVDDYERERKADGKADFDDLLEWARDMLVGSLEARAYFRRRFRAILVDEFQDTDPVQAEIALCIASDEEPGDDWLELRPRPGGLTVVGDPKQSIYRFRRADIAVYDAVRHGPLAGGEAQLVQNFRSVRGVLDWLNQVFDRVLVEQEGVQPANTLLRHGPSALDDESLSICVVHGTAASETADQIRAEEARLLATTIHRAVEEGWPIRDRASGQQRPAVYSDVTVLVPRRTALDIYLDAFRRADVPVRAEGGRSFFQRQEVRDLANMLQAIDDPLDQIALVASMRSSVLACTDENIYLHVAAGNRLDYRLPAENSPASVSEALQLLRDLHDLRSRVSLAQLVRATLQKTKLVEIALSGWDGQQSAANLVKLADRARAFSASGAGGLRGFARWLTEQRASSDEAEANVAEETDDVVRVMTVHASKGLEFPIVAIANLGSRPRNDVEPVPDRRTHRLHLRIKARDDEFKTPGFDTAWTSEQLQKDAEGKRLLYVALTRARDRLIVPRCSEPARPGPLLFELLPSLPPWDPKTAETSVDGRYVIDRDALPDLPDDDPLLVTAADEDAIATALAERDAWADRRAQTIRAARDELEVHPATKDEGDEPIPPAFLGADEARLIAGAGPPAEKGEALHRVLELVDLQAPDDLERITLAVCAVAGIEEHVDEVIELARACLASDGLARALRADRMWREVPYTLRVEDGYTTGRIDLVFEEAGELVVVDWKSDSVAPSQVEPAAESHRQQAEAYVRALTAATGKRAKEVIFVFPRARAEASMTFE